MKKIKVLLTKSFSDEYLKNFGADSIEWLQHPFITFNYKHLPHLQKQIEGIDAPFIFTSQNAVVGFERNVALNIESKVCFCLNGATQTALESSGWKIIATANSSERLAQKIIQSNIHEAIFCCGNIRMDVIPNKLQHAEIHLREFVVYETIFNPKVIENHFDAIVFFSPSGVESFFKMNRLQDPTKIYCLGEITASSLNIKAFKNIVISPTSTSNSLLKIIADDSR